MAWPRAQAGWIAPGLCAVAWLVLSWAPTPQLDDAYIFHRTALNLAEGHGLVFNPGEYVEGVSSLAWTALLALAAGIGVPPPAAAHGLGVVSGSLIFAAALWLARAVGLRGALGALPLLLLLTSTPLLRWSSSGMETLANAAVVTATLAAGARGRLVWATLLSCLATLLRMDAALVAAVVLGGHFLEAFVPRARASLGEAIASPSVRRAAVPALAFAAFVGLLTLWRLAYFGAPLPNTFYTKVGGTSLEFGLLYVANFLRDGALWWLPACVVAGVAEPRLRPALALVGLQLGYAVYVGGDAFGHARHLVAVVPALAVLTIRGSVLAGERDARFGGALFALVSSGALWQILGPDAWPALGVAALLAAGVAAGLPRLREGASSFAAFLVAAVLLAASLAEPSAWQRYGEGSKRAAGLRWAYAADRRLEALTQQRLGVLRERAARGEVVGLLGATGIGSIGYYSGLPILDLLGLVDATIARSELRPGTSQLPIPGHTRSNPDYVMSRRPDYLLIPRKSNAIPLLRAHQDLWQHADLERLYEWDPAMIGYRLKKNLRGEAPGPRR